MVLIEDSFASLWRPAGSSVPEAFGVARLFLTPLTSDPSIWYYDSIPGWVQGEGLAAARDDPFPLSGLDAAALELLGHCILVAIAARNHGTLNADIALSLDKLQSAQDPLRLLPLVAPGRAARSAEGGSDGGTEAAER